MTYSRHARQAALEDRYGTIQDLPGTLDLSKADPVEVSTEEGVRKVTKVVYRTRHSDTLDLVLVVVPERGGFFVKTVWLNETNDKHTSLRRERYAVPA